jgi:hypothetical protein
MSKGKGDKPSGFEDLMFEYTRPKGGGRGIPSRSDGPYARYYLGTRSKYSFVPLIFAGTLFTIIIAMFVLMIIQSGGSLNWNWDAELIAQLVLGLIILAVCIAAVINGIKPKEHPDDLIEREENEKEES